MSLFRHPAAEVVAEVRPPGRPYTRPIAPTDIHSHQTFNASRFLQAVRPPLQMESAKIAPPQRSAEQLYTPGIKATTMGRCAV
jgi:hypothetical protein